MAELVQEYGSADIANAKLFQIGRNVGERVCDEFLLHAEISHCKDLGEKLRVMAQAAFRAYIGVAGRVDEESSGTFAITFERNPLEENVEIPKRLADLKYSNVLAGVAQGALGVIGVLAECRLEKDKEGRTVIRVVIGNTEK